MKFTKMQGAGNDFIIVESSDTQRGWSSTAITICDRRFGVGADGLLLFLPSMVADFGMRIFNSDGSESNACGNGLRCLVKYFIDRDSEYCGSKELSIETQAGIRKAKIHKVTSEVTEIETGMGEPKLCNNDLLVINQGTIVDIKSKMDYSVTVDDKELCLHLVSMGNPHAVYFYEYSVSDFPLYQLGSKIETHKAFSTGTNFEVARVVNRQRIEARVWERGVGETLACGSGACAIAVVAQALGFVDSKIDIKLPGGVLSTEWNGKGEVFLKGSVEMVFTGEWLN